MKKLYVKEDKSRRPLDLRHGAFGTFPDLKPTSTAISLRLPNIVLAQIKVEAHRRGLPYQAHIKAVLADSLARR